jgi:hypothetical protein
MLPLISYGLPIWNVPDKQHRDKIHQLIARPLRCCLSLPQKSTGAMSVLVDAGLLSFDSMRKLAALRLGQSLHRLDQTDPCKPLLFTRNIVSTDIRAAEETSNISCADKKAVAGADKCFRAIDHNDWLFKSAGSKTLKALKPRPGLSQHLLLDDRVVCSLRSRLRLNRSSLNASLAERKVVPSALCSLCGVPESTEHCLLVCPRYAVARDKCREQLQNLGVAMTIDALLGNPEVLNSSRELPAALTITGEYLLAINKIRRL